MFEKKHERYGHPFLQFYKPIIGNQPRKKVFHMGTYVMVIEALKVTELTIVKKYKDTHDFRIGKLGFSLTYPIGWVLKEVFSDFYFEINTKIINKDENFSNFIS